MPTSGPKIDSGEYCIPLKVANQLASYFLHVPRPYPQRRRLATILVRMGLVRGYERLSLNTTTCPLHNAKQQNRKKDLAPAFRTLHRAARMFCRTFVCAVTPAYGRLLSIANNTRDVGLGAVANYRHFVSNERCSFELNPPPPPPPPNEHIH